MYCEIAEVRSQIAEVKALAPGGLLNIEWFNFCILTSYFCLSKTIRASVDGAGFRRSTNALTDLPKLVIAEVRGQISEVKSV